MPYMMQKGWARAGPFTRKLTSLTALAALLLALAALPLAAQTGSLFTQSQLFHEHGSVMLVIDPEDGRIVAANRTAREFYGYPDLLERSINEINQLTDDEISQEMRLAETQQRNYFNFEHVTLESGLRYVEVYSYPVDINGGTYLFSIIFDITERVVAEQTIVKLRRTLLAAAGAGITVVLVTLVLMILRMRGRLGSTQRSLERSQFRYRAYVDNAPLGIFVTDRNGRYVEVNDAACRLTGYESEELLSMTIADLIHPDDQSTAEQHFHSLLRGNPVREELRLRTKSGEMRWWSITATQLSEDLFLGLAEDATERKLAEQAHVTLAAVAANLQGYTTENIDIAQILSTVCSLSGATHASYTGSWPNPGCGSNPGPAHFTQEETADPGPAHSTQEETAIRVPVATDQRGFGDLALHFPAGQVLRNPVLLETCAGMLAITLARIETEARNAQLVHEKERLLKEVQHRVKNNMSAMNGLLELQTYSLANEDAVDAIKEAQSRFHSLGVLYEQLFRGEALDSASLWEYLSELVRRVVEVFPAIPGLQVVVNASPQQSDSNQQQSSDAGALEDARCMLDAKRLSTIGLIVNELITNAMKHAFRPDVESDAVSFEGAAIHRLLQVDARCTDDHIEISVADNGPGIPESYDLHTPSGFGLGMVRELVTQLNGEIRLESNIIAQGGTGARIVFSFPQ
ncbi:MAG: PAS domain S-box protein [Spirochaetaceae bacterium]|nr:MAG: PAS domain S-box protein [Spirochaetaceae bacterium]